MTYLDMKNQINIAELLEDCPKGMELYSPLCGECRVIRVYNYLGFDVINGTDDVFNFSYDGRYNLMGECCIFPSKDQRDWSKFVPPYKFKDGDVCYIKSTGLFEHIFIFKFNEDYKHIHDHVDLSENHFYTGENPVCTTDCVKEIRLATEEEKEKLFDAIKSHGYKWNEKTKTLEKLVKPKFKTGDKVVKKDSNEDVVLITDIADNYYIVETKYGMEVAISISIQNEYELVPNKFDINTLVPFESRVLVRHNIDNKWCGSFFSHIDGNFHSHCYKYVTTAGKSYPMCIPYEGNEHLLGTINECDEYYKNW